MTPTIETIQTVRPEPKEIEKLINERGGIRLTVYLSLDKAAPASGINPTRIRNLIDKVSQSLAENGMNEERIADFIQPMQDILEQPETLLRTGESVGFFLDQDSARSLELPYAVETDCHVGNRFLIKPLLRLYQRNPSFTVLCLNRNDVRVFRGSRAGLESVAVPGMPGKLKDITDIDDPEKSVQHHTSKTTSAGGRPGKEIAAHFHGHGLPSDLEDTQFQRFFRSVGQCIDKYLNGSQDPLIVFGVQQNIGLFKKLHHFSSRVLLYSAHDPHQWSPKQIKEEAWAILRPELEATQDEALEKLSEALGRNEAIAGVENCALAAAMGRIEFAAVATDRAIYGQCDLDNLKVRIIEDGTPLCGNDLLDFIASETVRNGGKIAALPLDKIPGTRGVAAITRFPMELPQQHNETERNSDAG